MAEKPRRNATGKRVPGSKRELKDRLEMHAGLKKAESLLAVQMRCGKIGLAVVPYARKVPGVESASRECGWRRQDVKKLLMFCPEWEVRREMLEVANAKDYETLLSINVGLKDSSKWLWKAI